MAASVHYVERRSPGTAKCGPLLRPSATQRRPSTRPGSRRAPYRRYIVLRRGTHPKVVQEMLGHRTIAITLDPYSHIIPPMHKDAAQQFRRLFPKSERESWVSVRVPKAK